MTRCPTSSLENKSRSLDLSALVAILFSEPTNRENWMLPPFIIEQIRKREQEERVRYEQPQLDLPLAPMRSPKPAEDGDHERRGVIILELL